MSINRGVDGIPHRVGMLAVDTAAVLHVFQAVQAALFGRRNGAGGCGMQFDLMRTTASFLAQKDCGTPDGRRAAVWNEPACGRSSDADGWLVFTLVKNEHFARLMTAIGRPELANDPRYAGFDERRTHAEELVSMMTDLMAQRSTAEWSAILRECEVLNNPINSIGDRLADAHVRGVGAVGRIDQPDSWSGRNPDCTRNHIRSELGGARYR